MVTVVLIESPSSRPNAETDSPRLGLLSLGPVAIRNLSSRIWMSEGRNLDHYPDDLL